LIGQQPPGRRGLLFGHLSLLHGSGSMHKSRGVGGGETHTLSRCEKTRAAKTSAVCAFGRRPAHANASSHLRAPRPAGACRLFDVEGGAAPPTAAAGSRHAPHRASGTEKGMPTGNGAERAGRGHDTTNRATQTSALPTLAANGRLHARSVRWAQVVAPATVAAAATAVGVAAPGEALSIPKLRSTPRCGRGSPAAIMREAAGAPKVDGRSNEVCNWRAASSRAADTRSAPAALCHKAATGMRLDSPRWLRKRREAACGWPVAVGVQGRNDDQRSAHAL